MSYCFSTQSYVDTKTGENIPKLEFTRLEFTTWQIYLTMEVVDFLLVHCKVVNNDYQGESRDLYTYVPSRGFEQSPGGKW